VIEKADPRARIIVIAAFVALVLCGTAIIAFADAVRAVLVAWIASDAASARSRAVIVSIVLAAAVILPVVGIAAYLWRFGTRVVREARFPPCGATLIVDTMVIEGAEAHQRGRMLQVLAIGLSTISLLFMIAFLRLIALTSAR
jgi:hypothetical protein